MDSLSLAEHNCRYARSGSVVPAQNKGIFSQRQRKQTRPAYVVHDRLFLELMAAFN
jgi:hypothetical protein